MNSLLHRHASYLCPVVSSSTSSRTTVVMGRPPTSKLLRWYLLFQHLLIYPRASIPVRVLHTSSRPSLGCCLSTFGDSKAMNKEKRMTVSDCMEECFPPSRVRALSFSKVKARLVEQSETKGRAFQTKVRSRSV